MLETWSAVFAGIIPKENYTACVCGSEENGLIINLTGKKHRILIDFGVVNGFQMLDEGMLLCAPPAPNFTELRKNGFSNILYLVENGSFGRYSKACLGDGLFQELGYREYIIVTLNYVISVVTRWEPDITVTPIQ